MQIDKIYKEFYNTGHENRNNPVKKRKRRSILEGRTTWTKYKDVEGSVIIHRVMKDLRAEN